MGDGNGGLNHPTYTYFIHLTIVVYPLWGWRESKPHSLVPIGLDLPASASEWLGLQATCRECLYPSAGSIPRVRLVCFCLFRERTSHSIAQADLGLASDLP